ncbi:glycerol uptake facilitator protein [Paucilactobacillus oligofermentans DSM 15707 = LMG 22743]|uniref:Glycerol uptake facilitator protein n=1 Tax=Paucilactobacillus oligofermentans DSM 15707 = LMG 22743 TaxID=1423778 RepID=A0A0R1RL34_9LACO|nr:MIP/aquaporin family protein [Paucilactobacillus oligofermentans]KRL57743.1 glycerol uptake facilitator protein [Paucilactobacillus oligofermentans DSM 15707 = LMG 22743]
MSFDLGTKLAAEFFGTMILIIFGNGAVANMALEKTTGRHDGGWLFVALGYGFGVMIPAFMFGSISGNHLNPAVTLGFACAGLFPWNQVFGYIVAQFAGAIVGQLIIVICYWPFYKKTQNESAVLMTFATGDGADSSVNGFINETIGTLLLVFGAIGAYHGMFIKDNIDLANIAVGLLIMTLVISMGGATGPALNPARDLGPRLVHAILPIPNKGSSNWHYSWVPIVAPIIGGIAGAILFVAFFPTK